MPRADGEVRCEASSECTASGHPFGQSMFAVSRGEQHGTAVTSRRATTTDELLRGGHADGLDLDVEGHLWLQRDAALPGVGGVRTAADRAQAARDQGTVPLDRGKAKPQRGLRPGAVPAGDMR